MRLIDVYDHPEAPDILYRLLSEREPHQNISHKQMPSFDEHLGFFMSRPYADWVLIEDVPGVNDGQCIIGAAYLTHANEIGVWIFQRWHRRGFGQHAVKSLMAKHGARRYIANVAPDNVTSREMFEGLGFKHVQNTFALETK